MLDAIAQPIRPMLRLRAAQQVEQAEGLKISAVSAHIEHFQTLLELLGADLLAQVDRSQSASDVVPGRCLGQQRSSPAVWFV